jgi:hypothetical protein
VVDDAEDAPPSPLLELALAVEDAPSEEVTGVGPDDDVDATAVSAPDEVVVPDAVVVPEETLEPPPDALDEQASGRRSADAPRTQRIRLASEACVRDVRVVMA